MGNHFHLLVKMLPEYKFTDKNIKTRYVGFYGDDRVFAEGRIPSLRAKLSSLSEFIREIKVGFARYYNKRHNRRGYFWGDRFKRICFKDIYAIQASLYFQKKPKPVKGLSGVYSLKRLSEVI